jgi:hypothetical protein
MEEGFQVISELEDSEAQDTASDISDAEELSDNFQKAKFFKKTGNKHHH